jgi:hypothetical protein
MTTRQHFRGGVATIWVLVVLSALVAVIATTTSTYVMVRRAQRNREYKLQSEWLARSGIELAAARLLADPKDYRGEKVQLIPNSQVEIEVKAEADGVFEVVSSARYPTYNGSKASERAQKRVFRRVVEGDKARLEVIAPTP